MLAISRVQAAMPSQMLVLLIERQMASRIPVPIATSSTPVTGMTLSAGELVVAIAAGGMACLDQERHRDRRDPGESDGREGNEGFG